MNSSEILQNALSKTDNVFNIRFDSGAELFIRGPLGGQGRVLDNFPITANLTDESGNILSSIVFDPNKVEFFYPHIKSK
ncbi:MAG: hypothetical protein ACI4UI_05935 [Levilactobacillus brevis]